MVTTSWTIIIADAVPEDTPFDGKTVKMLVDPGLQTWPGAGDTYLDGFLTRDDCITYITDHNMVYDGWS